MFANVLLQCLIASGITAFASTSKGQSRFLARKEENSSAKKVIFVHDACIDDFMCTTILGNAHRAGEIEFLGSVVINGDSTLPYSVDLTYKMHKALGIMDVPISLSNARLFNAFPWGYRSDTMNMYNLSTVGAVDVDVPAQYTDGDAWLATTLENAEDNSITIAHVATMTNMGELFKKQKRLASKVKEIVWMAGAVNVPGNLDKSQYQGFNDLAEWNVYGDPYNAAWMMENTQIPIKLFPLDISNKVPVAGEFMDDLKAAGENPSNEAVYNILFQAYATFAAPQPFYRLWDTAAITYIVRPEFYDEPQALKLTCVTDWTNQGWLAQEGQVNATFWREVQVFFNYTTAGESDFFRYVAQQAAGGA